MFWSFGMFPPTDSREMIKMPKVACSLTRIRVRREKRALPVIVLIATSCARGTEFSPTGDGERGSGGGGSAASGPGEMGISEFLRVWRWGLREPSSSKGTCKGRQVRV